MVGTSLIFPSWVNRIMILDLMKINSTVNTLEDYAMAYMQ
jgi:poly(3-hydroxyalkanoate) synthetase